MPDQTPPIRWQPDRTPAAPAWPIPPLLTAMGRGAVGRCPACGQTRCFQGFLRVVPVCANCTAPLGSLRADDLPPYLTIFVAGHLVVPLMLWTESAFQLDFGTQALIWLPITAVLTTVLLRPVKGAVLGLMLKLGMAKTDDE